MSNPELSIIVPVYNTGKFLGKAIDSLLNQTFKDIEVILIDDGSTDNSGNICDDYAGKDSRIIVVHKENGGQGKARNLGISKARGKYITFLDSDDFVDLNVYEKVITTSKLHNLDINRFRYVQFMIDDKEPEKADYTEPLIYSDKDDIRQAALCLFSIPVNATEKDLNFGGSACCAIYKRDLLIDNEIQFPCNSKFVSEDFIFNFYCLQYAQRVGVSDSVFYHYRVNPTSTTHKPNLNMVKKSIDTCRFLEKEFMRFGYEEKAKNYALGFSIDILRAYLKNVFMSSLPLSEKIKWVKEQSRIDYFDKVYTNYNWKNLSFKHKLNFWAFYNRHALLLYSLIVGQEKFRAIVSRLSGNEKMKFGHNSKRRH